MKESTLERTFASSTLKSCSLSLSTHDAKAPFKTICQLDEQLGRHLLKMAGLDPDQLASAEGESSERQQDIREVHIGTLSIENDYLASGESTELMNKIWSVIRYV